MPRSVYDCKSNSPLPLGEQEAKPARTGWLQCLRSIIPLISVVALGEPANRTARRVAGGKFSKQVTLVRQLHRFLGDAHFDSVFKPVIALSCYARRCIRGSGDVNEVAGRRFGSCTRSSFSCSHSRTAWGSNRTEVPILKLGIRLVAANLYTWRSLMLSIPASSGTVMADFRSRNKSAMNIFDPPRLRSRRSLTQR